MSSPDLYFFSLSLKALWLGNLMVLFFYFPKLRQRQGYSQMLFWYGLIAVFFTLAQDLSGIFLQHHYLHEIGNGFVFSEMVLLGWVFFKAMEESALRKIVQALISFYVLYYVVVLFFFSANSYAWIRWGRDLCMIIISLIFFFYMIRKLPEENLMKFPMFWISATLLFYFSGTFILSFIIDYIRSEFAEYTAKFMSFRNFFRFSICLVLAYAGWLDYQRIPTV